MKFSPLRISQLQKDEIQYMVELESLLRYRYIILKINLFKNISQNLVKDSLNKSRGNYTSYLFLKIIVLYVHFLFYLSTYFFSNFFIYIYLW